MKTFEECRAIMAKEGNFTTKLLMPPEYEAQAAELYANEKLKGLLEEVKQLAVDYRQDWNIEAATPCDRIVNRIEELINEPNTP